MRHAVVLAGVLAVAVVWLGLPGMAHAQSVNIGVQTSSMQLGINIGPQPPPVVVIPPPAVAAPGSPPPPVYYAPNLPYNYFVYKKTYYLYHQGRWFRGRGYNGPWTAIAIAQVPRPILAVPAEHYHNRPAHWERHGPPPWAHEQAQERHGDHGQGHAYGHDKHKDHE